MDLNVYLVARTHFDSEAFLTFLARHDLGWERSEGATSPEELVEAAGRICYLSFGTRQFRKDNEEYIKHLIKMGHESVLEHVSWSFLLEGVSRSFTHQLVRHRVGFSYSQLSQQYCDAGDTEFVEPPLWEKLPDEQRKKWNELMQKSSDTYRSLMEGLDDGGKSKEGKEGLIPIRSRKERLRAIRSIARSVLPNATETKILLTANARALRHFLRVRGSIEGDLEMKMVTSKMLDHLKHEAPSIFFDF